jgi:uncharacterized protein YndB with AHSA1/START domain
MNATTETDRIERSVTIDAPRTKVWRALTNAEEFGEWFGCNLKGQEFAPGRRTRGPITFKGYEHLFFDVTVERIEPESLFSYRWIPYPMDPSVDYSKEEPTLVTFTLRDAPGGGTLLKVVESGFDKVPAGRRLEAFRMNSSGWDGQMQNIVRHMAEQARSGGAAH